MSWPDDVMRWYLQGNGALVRWLGPGDPPQALIDDPFVTLVDARSAEDLRGRIVVGSGERSRSEQDTRLNEEFAEWMRKEKGGNDDDDG